MHSHVDYNVFVLRLTAADDEVLTADTWCVTSYVCQSQRETHHQPGNDAGRVVVFYFECFDWSLKCRQGVWGLCSVHVFSFCLLPFCVGVLTFGVGPAIFYHICLDYCIIRTKTKEVDL